MKAKRRTKLQIEIAKMRNDAILTMARRRHMRKILEPVSQEGLEHARRVTDEWLGYSRERQAAQARKALEWHVAIGGGLLAAALAAMTGPPTWFVQLLS